MQERHPGRRSSQTRGVRCRGAKAPGHPPGPCHCEPEGTEPQLRDGAQSPPSADSATHRANPRGRTACDLEPPEAVTQMGINHGIPQCCVDRLPAHLCGGRSQSPPARCIRSSCNARIGNDSRLPLRLCGAAVTTSPNTKPASCRVPVSRLVPLRCMPSTVRTCCGPLDREYHGQILRSTPAPAIGQRIVWSALISVVRAKGRCGHSSEQCWPLALRNGHGPTRPESPDHCWMDRPSNQPVRCDGHRDSSGDVEESKRHIRRFAEPRSNNPGHANAPVHNSKTSPERCNARGGCKPQEDDDHVADPTADTSIQRTAALRSAHGLERLNNSSGLAVCSGARFSGVMKGAR